MLAREESVCRHRGRLSSVALMPRSLESDGVARQGAGTLLGHTAPGPAAHRSSGPGSSRFVRRNLRLRDRDSNLAGANVQQENDAALQTQPQPLSQSYQASQVWSKPPRGHSRSARMRPRRTGAGCHERALGRPCEWGSVREVDVPGWRGLGVAGFRQAGRPRRPVALHRGSRLRVQ
jgi:hypothetical protein